MPLFYKLGQKGSEVFPFAIYYISMLSLFAASSTYHFFSGRRQVKVILQKIDHMMIFFMIAGSYTPICLVSLSGPSGTRLMAAIWFISLLGMAMNILWIDCPKWLSSVIYILLGWICVFLFKELVAVMPRNGLVLLLSGGLAYTVGGIIYAIKPNISRFLPNNFGNHEVFHCFVVLGAFLHYLMVLTLI